MEAGEQKRAGCKQHRHVGYAPVHTLAFLISILVYANILLTICAPGQRRYQRTSRNTTTRNSPPHRMTFLTLSFNRSSPLPTSPTTSAWTVSTPLKSSWPLRRSSASRFPTRMPTASTQVREVAPTFPRSVSNNAHTPVFYS